MFVACIDFVMLFMIRTAVSVISDASRHMILEYSAVGGGETITNFASVQLWRSRLYRRHRRRWGWSARSCCICIAIFLARSRMFWDLIDRKFLSTNRAGNLLRRVIIASIGTVAVHSFQFVEILNLNKKCKVIHWYLF